MFLQVRLCKLADGMDGPVTLNRDAVLAQPTRRCRQHPIAPGSARPSWLLAAFFTAALLQMLAGAAAGIAYAATGQEWLRWLALHLVLLGGISQLVLGAGQFFTCAFVATDPPSRRLVGAQLAAWNLGTALIGVGVPTELAALFESGATLLGTALVLFGLALRGTERRSRPGSRARWRSARYPLCARVNSSRGHSCSGAYAGSRPITP